MSSASSVQVSSPPRGQEKESFSLNDAATVVGEGVEHNALSASSYSSRSGSISEGSAEPINLPNKTEVQAYNDMLMSRPLFRDSLLQSIVLTTLNLQAQEQLIKNSNEMDIINEIVDGFVEDGEKQTAFLAAFADDGYLFLMLPPAYQIIVRNARQESESERTASAASMRVQRGGNRQFLFLQICVCLLYSLLIGGFFGGISHMVLGPENVTMGGVTNSIGSALGQGATGLVTGAVGGIGSGLATGAQDATTGFLRFWNGETTEQPAAAITYIETLLTSSTPGVFFIHGDPVSLELRTQSYRSRTQLMEATQRRQQLSDRILGTIDNSFRLSYRPQLDTLLQEIAYSRQELQARLGLLESQRDVLVSIVRGTTGISRSPVIPREALPTDLDAAMLVSWMDSDFTGPLALSNSVVALLRSRKYNVEAVKDQYELFHLQKRHERTYQETLALLSGMEACFTNTTVATCTPRALLGGLCHLLVQRAETDADRSQALQLCGLHPRIQEEGSEARDRVVAEEAPFAYLVAAMPAEMQQLAIDAEGVFSVPSSADVATSESKESEATATATATPSASAASESKEPEASASSSFSMLGSQSSSAARTTYGTATATPSPQFSSLAFAPTPLQIVPQPLPPSATPTAAPETIGAAVEAPTPQSTLIPIPITRVSLNASLFSTDGALNLTVLEEALHNNTEIQSLATMWNGRFPRATGNSAASEAEPTESTLVQDVAEMMALEEVLSMLQDSQQRNILRETEAVDTYMQAYITEAHSRITVGAEDSPKAMERTLRFYTLLARMGLVLKPHVAQDVYSAILSDGLLISYETAFSRLNTKTNSLEAHFRTEDEVPLSGPFYIFSKLFELLNLIFKHVDPNEWSDATRSIFGITTGGSFLSMLLPLLLKSCCPSIRQTIVESLCCASRPTAVEGPVIAALPRAPRRLRNRAGSVTASTRSALTTGAESGTMVAAAATAATAITAGTPSQLPLPQLTNGAPAPGVLTQYVPPGGGAGYLGMQPPVNHMQIYHPQPHYPLAPFPPHGAMFHHPPPPFFPPYGGQVPLLAPPYPSGGAMVLRAGPPGNLVTSGEALANAVMAQRTNAPGAPSASEIIRQLTNNPVTAGLLQDALGGLGGGDRSALVRWIQSAGKGHLLQSNSAAGGTSRKRTYKRKNARVLTRKRRIA